MLTRIKGNSVTTVPQSLNRYLVFEARANRLLDKPSILFAELNREHGFFGWVDADSEALVECHSVMIPRHSGRWKDFHEIDYWQPKMESLCVVHRTKLWLRKTPVKVKGCSVVRRLGLSGKPR